MGWLLFTKFTPTQRWIYFLLLPVPAHLFSRDIHSFFFFDFTFTFSLSSVSVRHGHVPRSSRWPPGWPQMSPLEHDDLDFLLALFTDHIVIFYFHVEKLASSKRQRKLFSSTNRKTQLTTIEPIENKIGGTLLIIFFTVGTAVVCLQTGI